MAINANKLKEMFESGSQTVANEFAYIDQLNVYPVPDGDTGTNMKMTLLGAVPAIQDLSSVELVSKQYARGLLMNARGNSGVIFSQIMRGFASNLVGKKELNDVESVIVCFEKASEMGYKSVMAPVEGTILSVIRMTAEKLRSTIKKYNSAESVFNAAVSFAKEAVDLTPTMLKQLKEANVVDSGGYGLQRFLDGMNMAIKNEKVVASNKSQNNLVNNNQLTPGGVMETGFGYCSEFIIKLSKKDMAKFKEKDFEKVIEKIGNSTVIVRDEDIIKVHTHTLKPGALLASVEKFGDFEKIKIDNMSLQVENHQIINTAIEQHSNDNLKLKIKATKHSAKEKIVKKITEMRTKSKGTATIVAVPTKEIGEKLVKEYAVNYYINQQKIGNPSTQIFLDAITHVNSMNTIIVTDNANIVMAAQAAAKEIKTSKVWVVSAKTIIQAMACALVFNPNTEIRTNYRKMKHAMKDVHTAMISTSVKNIKYDDLYVKKNDYIGMHKKKVLAAGTTLLPVLKKMIDILVQKRPKSKLVQVITGIEHTKKDLDALKKYIKSKYDLKIDIIEGNQDVYPFILGV